MRRRPSEWAPYHPPAYTNGNLTTQRCTILLSASGLTICLHFRLLLFIRLLILLGQLINPEVNFGVHPKPHKAANGELTTPLVAVTGIVQNANP
jgi:hypothetical protein